MVRDDRAQQDHSAGHSCGTVGATIENRSESTMRYSYDAVDMQKQVLSFSHKGMRRFPQIFCLAALLFLFSPLVTAQQKLTYVVEYATEHTGRIHVQIVPSSPINSPATLVIPRAIPSGYAQQFYDRYVEKVKATTSSETPVKKQDGPRWRVEQPGLTKIEYEVDLARLEQEILDASAASKARPEYVGLLGYSVL